MNRYVAFILYLIAILGFVAVTLSMNRALGPGPAASAIKLDRSSSTAAWGSLVSR